MTDTRDDLLETGREFYFTTGQVATVLEVSRTTVKRFESTGRLRALKNRRGWRYFNAGDVFTFLEGHSLKEHSLGGPRP